MLSRLYISNYALIEELEISFDCGFTVITGETGAGKSILLGALSLLLGGRADARAVRNADRKIVVEATFDVDGYSLESLFDENDIEYFAHECIIRREVAANGRSRAFVNDTPVNLGVLKDITTCLVDIHSQHSNMLLSTQSFQLNILDSLAGNGALLEKYTASYKQLVAIEKEITHKKELIEKSRAEEDYISFQLEQFKEINLHENEDAELESLQHKLSNVGALKEALCTVDHLLTAEGVSVIENLKAIEQQLSFTEEVMEETSGMAERVSNCIIDLKDIAMTVSHAQDDLNLDPAELQRVDERLDTIYTLERKHNVDSVNELLEIQKQFEEKLSTITSGDEEISQLEATLKAVNAQTTELAEELRSKRKKAADAFIEEFKPLVASLGLKNIAFKVDFSDTRLSATGADSVEFMMAFNKNQALMPVKDTASGGEMSRVMLCIKSILARHMHLPTIIFDEIDTGVSGDIASMIGEMMASIASSIQVVTISHLPQVAACATSHKKVFKTDSEASTSTSVMALDNEQHVMEIARMLSGKDLDEAAINNAKSLINQYVRR